jgi:hypothetical protein
MPGSPELTSLWRPLRASIFRNLIIADVVSDIGAFMQSTGAAWLMVSLSAGPMYVALTQTASALAFFLFALPAGAIGDIVDRRKLILYTETWMAGVAPRACRTDHWRLVGPLSLLILTLRCRRGCIRNTILARCFAGLGQERGPSGGIRPQRHRVQFCACCRTGARGFVIAAAGAGTAFLINTVSFVGLFSWLRAGSERFTRGRRHRKQ